MYYDDRAEPTISDLNRFLQMVLRAILDERKAQLFYSQLLNRAITPFQKRNIQHALDDEIKHERMLTRIYQHLSGEAPQVLYPTPEDIADFAGGLQKALEDELEAAEQYRDLLQMTSLQWLRDELFELQTDEMEHATRFAFLRAEL